MLVLLNPSNDLKEGFPPLVQIPLVIYITIGNIKKVYSKMLHCKLIIK